MKLTEGAVGEIYLATYVPANKTVALKKMTLTRDNADVSFFASCIAHSLTTPCIPRR